MGTNPFLNDVLLSLARKALTAAATYLVTNGWLREDQTEQIIAGVALFAASVAWSFWQRYKDRLLLLVAAGAPQGTTVAEVKKIAADDKTANPPVTLPDTATPPRVHKP